MSAGIGKLSLFGLAKKLREVSRSATKIKHPKAKVLRRREGRFNRVLMLDRKRNPNPRVSYFRSQRHFEEYALYCAARNAQDWRMPKFRRGSAHNRRK